MSELFSNTIVQAALVSAASHVVVWFVKLLPQLPGGYNSAKRALAIKLLKVVADAPTPAQAPIPAIQTLEMPLPSGLAADVAAGTNTLARGI